jgi:hypothetical protein
MPMGKKLGKGSVQTKTPQVGGSNIYSEMVTRNMTEHTYTTWIDGTGVAVHASSRVTAGGDLQRSQTPTFAARQPKGMLLRTAEGPSWVSMAPGNPTAGYNVTKQ